MLQRKGNEIKRNYTLSLKMERYKTEYIFEGEKLNQIKLGKFFSEKRNDLKRDTLFRKMKRYKTE